MYEINDPHLTIQLVTAIVSIALFGVALFLYGRQQRRRLADRKPKIFVADPAVTMQPAATPDKVAA